MKRVQTIWREYAILLIMTTAWTAVLASYAILRHQRLNSTVYDLGIKSQVIWNTWQGRWFASSIEVNNYLGDHLQLVFLLLAPLFSIWEDVRILLLVQSLLLGLGAIPLYRIARRRLGNNWLALAFAAAYLLYPTVGFVNRFDFHPVTFTIFFIFMALDLLETDHPIWASLFVLLALMSREEVGFTIFALGLYVFFVMKRRRVGALWSIGGLIWSITAVFFVIPFFRGGVSDSVGRYDWLGGSPGETVITLISHPITSALPLLSDPVRQQFLMKLLLPVGFLSILAPLPLAVALPALAYNLLSDVPSQSSIYFHYISPMIPFIFLAAIQGTGWLQKRLNGRFRPAQFTLIIIGWLTVSVIAAWLLDNPFTTVIDDPFYPVYGLDTWVEQAPFREAQSLLPPDAELATMMGYGPHLALRQQFYLFFDGQKFKERPFGFPQTDYALINLSDLRWGVNGRIFHSAIETAIGHYGYEALYFQNDVVLLHPMDTAQPQTGAVIQRIIDLQEAGGKYTPTAQSTLDWMGSQWLVEELPATAVSAPAQFAEGIQLLGYELSEKLFAPGTAVCTTLYWTTTTSLATDYTVFLHFTAADGFVNAQRDNPPALGFSPTSQWLPGEIIADMHCLQIPTVQPGDYHLKLGLYNPETNSRLPLLTTSQITGDDALNLVTLPITE